MGVWYNSAEGGTSGALVTTGNSGGASGTAFNAVSGVYFRADGAHGGALALGVDNPGTALGNIRWGLGNDSTLLACRLWLRLSTVPTVYGVLVHISDAADATVARIGYDSVGRLTIQQPGSLTVWTATAPLAAGTLYRVEMILNTGTTSLDGTAQLRYALGDDVDPVEDSGVIAGNFGSGGGLLNFRAGKYGSQSYTGNLRMDDLRVHTGADYAGWIGTGMPTSTTLATTAVELWPGQSATLTATASGTPASYVWSTTAGTLSGSGATRTLYCPPSLTDQVATITVDVTDASGIVSSKTVDVMLYGSTRAIRVGGVIKPTVGWAK